MTTHEQIIKQKQHIARYEKSLGLEKLKKRRADTRHKIELGGLVIKSGMNAFSKAIILGALDYTAQLLTQEQFYRELFETKAEILFLNSSKL